MVRGMVAICRDRRRDGLCCRVCEVDVRAWDSVLGDGDGVEAMFWIDACRAGRCDGLLGVGCGVPDS